MSLSEDQVRHVAKLARLELSDEGVRRAAEELSSILGYVEKLNALDTEGVEPLAHVLEVQNAFRPDQIEPCLPPDEALRNAPEASAGFFKVPKIQS